MARQKQTAVANVDFLEQGLADQEESSDSKEETQKNETSSVPALRPTSEGNPVASTNNSDVNPILLKRKHEKHSVLRDTLLSTSQERCELPMTQSNNSSQRFQTSRPIQQQYGNISFLSNLPTKKKFKDVMAPTSMPPEIYRDDSLPSYQHQ